MLMRTRRPSCRRASGARPPPLGAFFVAGEARGGVPKRVKCDWRDPFPLEPRRLPPRSLVFFFERPACPCGTAALRSGLGVL